MVSIENSLYKYIRAHTEIVPQPGPDVVDVGLAYVHVYKKPKPDPECLREHILKHIGKVNGRTLNPLDGKPYRYREIASWLGDRERALRFMALAHATGLAVLPTFPAARIGAGVSADVAHRAALLMESVTLTAPHAREGAGG